MNFTIPFTSTTLNTLYVPPLVCKFDNYTQSYSGVMFLIYFLAAIGLFKVLFDIFGWIRGR